MKLPLGMLIYWVKKFTVEKSVITGIWYYKSFYVPQSKEEKKNSVQDLKSKRCTVISVYGTFDQISDILMQGDSFTNGGEFNLVEFRNTIHEIELLGEMESYKFDDIYNSQGTALMIDTIIEVEETMEALQMSLTNGRPVTVRISGDWSYSNDLFDGFK